MRTFFTPQGTRIDLDGVKLRGLRTSQGLTLAALADLVGCSFSAIGHYERESMCPGSARLDGLRRVFGAALESSGAIVVTP